VWGVSAEDVASNARRGDAVIIPEGKHQTRKWTDRDGKDHWTTEVHTFSCWVKKKESANLDVPQDFVNQDDDELSKIPF
jgi:hypothetical protein